MSTVVELKDKYTSFWFSRFFGTQGKFATNNCILLYFLLNRPTAAKNKPCYDLNELFLKRPYIARLFLETSTKHHCLFMLPESNFFERKHAYMFIKKSRRFRGQNIFCEQNSFLKQQRFDFFWFWKPLKAKKINPNILWNLKLSFFALNVSASREKLIEKHDLIRPFRRGEELFPAWTVFIILVKTKSQYFFATGCTVSFFSKSN